MELLRAPPASPIPISKASLLRGKSSLKKSLLASSSAYWMPTLASVTMPVSSLFVSKATNLQAGTSIISVESAKKDVLTALSQIIDPDFGTDIVSCGFVKDLHIDDVLKEVSFRLELTTPACPIKDVFEQKANEVVATIPWVEKVNVKMSAQPAKPVFAGELPKGLQTISNIIAVSSCKMASIKDLGMSAIWDRDTKIIFCDLCLIEVELGNRPKMHFNSDGWKHILKSFHEKIGREYTKVQLKNKWDQIKKDWKLWKELKRGLTGLGWNPIRKTIATSDDWWMEKLQVMPNAKKFRFAGIDPEMEEKLDRMFVGVVATGEYVWTPVMGTPREKSPVVDINENGVNESNDESEGSQGNRVQSKPPPSKCKRKAGGDFLRDQIVQFVTTCSSWTSTPEALKEKMTNRATIADAIKVLDNIPEVCNDLEFYVSCVGELEDPVKCKSFHDPTSRAESCISPVLL